MKAATISLRTWPGPAYGATLGHANVASGLKITVHFKLIYAAGWQQKGLSVRFLWVLDASRFRDRPKKPGFKRTKSKSKTHIT